MFRKLHRWFSLPLFLFILLVLATGVGLQIEETIGTLASDASGAGAPKSGPASRTPERMSDAGVQAMVGDALARARAAQPDFQPQRVELSLAPGREMARLAIQPRGGPFITVEHASGITVAEMNPRTPLHVWLIRLHTGSLGGAGGIWVMLLTSFALLFLSISGLVLYWQMWSNRKKRGRKNLFWN